ncbi:MAG: GFA family protein [Myxococcales bacterium]|nr:GFA family protein [Myxococcales bacterium]
MCRKQHGAAFATYAQVKRAAITIDDPKAQLRRYASSEKAARLFCGTCGSSLFWESNDHPELLGVAVGALDVPLGVPVLAHIYVGSKADWVTLSDGVPGYEGDYAGPPVPRDA